MHDVDTARTGVRGPLGPAALVSLAGFLVFGLEAREAGYAVLAVAVALGLVPVAPAGTPVLAAAVVAILVGVVTRAADPTEVPGPDDLPSGRDPA